MIAADPLDHLADSEVVARLVNRGVDLGEARVLVRGREYPFTLSTILQILGYTVDDMPM